MLVDITAVNKQKIIFRNQSNLKDLTVNLEERVEERTKLFAGTIGTITNIGSELIGAEKRKESV